MLYNNTFGNLELIDILVKVASSKLTQKEIKDLKSSIPRSNVLKYSTTDIG